MRSSWIIFIGAVCWQAAQGQELTVAPQEITLRMVAGGPLSARASFQITTAQAWQAAVSNADMATLSPRSGNAAARVTVSLVDWWSLRQQPGEYESSITVRAGEATQTIKLRLIVSERVATQFTYLSGPQGCQTVADLLPENAAVCTVEEERPPGTFTPPARGGSYVDPNFGAMVRVIGDRGSLHGYSSPSAISASGRYALITNNFASYSAVQLRDGNAAYDRVPFGIEGTMWDPTNDHWLYAFGAGATIQRYDLETGRTEVVANFGERFRGIGSGGTGEISKDGWVAFYAPNEKQICATDLQAANPQPYCAATTRSIDFVTMAKGVDRTTGKRFVVLIGSGPFQVYSVNLLENRLDEEARGPENVWMDNGNRDGVCDAGESCSDGSHADTYEDSEGNQQIVVGLETQTPCGFGLYALHLGAGAQMGVPAELGGGMRRLLPLFRCGGQDKWLDYHVGCAKSSPHCAVSITSELYNVARDPADTTPLRRTPYLGEVLVIRDNGVEIRRLAMHRSLRFANEDGRGYWSTPRASISPDGAWVVADSNFGIPNEPHTVAIETGFGATKIQQEDGVVNVASLEERFAPGVPAMVLGAGLSFCRHRAEAPLPSELCGTRVTVGDKEARLLAVSPERVDFLWPDVATGGEVAVRVSRGEAARETDAVALSSEAVAERAPALFTTMVDATPWAFVAFTGAAETGEARAMRRGETATIFATGLGPTTPLVGEGEVGPMEPLARLDPAPEVYVNDVRQSVSFAGLAPGLVAIYQINFTLDPATTILEQNHIWVFGNGAESARRSIRIAP